MDPTDAFLRFKTRLQRTTLEEPVESEATIGRHARTELT